MGKVTEESILEYLKSMKFKRAIFGVSKTDALLKMRKLHQMYRQLLSEGQVSPSEKAMREEKIAAVANAFVDMMERTSTAKLEAQSEAVRIVAEARKQADEILEAAARTAEELLTGCGQEVEVTLERQLRKIREEMLRGGEKTAPDPDMGVIDIGIRRREKKAAASGSDSYVL